MVGRAALNITGSNQTYFFKGDKYVKIHWTPGTTDEGISYGPTEFIKEWASLKEAGFAQIDGILPIPGHDYRAYFFSGNKYARIEYVPGAPGDKILGGVRSISDAWPSLAKAGFNHVDGALIVPGKTDEAYIFSGEQYVRIKFTEGQTNDELLDGPKAITTGWSVIKFKELDTILPRPGSDNGAYIFSGDKWGEQVAKAVATGTTWMGQIKRVARLNHGFSAHAMRRLHQCVLIPRITYAADVWFTPVTKTKKKSPEERARGERSPRDLGSAGFAKKLASVQRRSAIAITGALRTTSNLALDAHANILPIDLAMNLACFRATIRMVTLPASNPLRRCLTKAQRYVKRHRSALHELLHFFNILPSSFEPVPESPATPRILKILNPTIPSSREVAMAAAKQANADVLIYSDGSGVDGGIGAAAVLCRAGQPSKTLRLHLGSDEQHVVYEAELVGAMLALHLLAGERDVESAWIGIDNQAVLHAMRSPVVNSAPHLVLAVAGLTKRLVRSHPGLAITTTWVPAHEGIPGNELADVAAKEAARGMSSGVEELPIYLRDTIAQSPAATKQAYKETLKKTWKQRWDGEISVGNAQLRIIDHTTPSNTFHKLAQTIPRRHASLLIQLRTGHVPLMSYLHRFGHSDSPTCPACEQRAENVEHYLMWCPAYEHARRRRDIAFPAAAGSLPTLLSSEEAVRHLMTYIRETGRFPLLARA